MFFKWKIFSADLNPVIGSEQKGPRPVLIISDGDYSVIMPLIIIMLIFNLFIIP